MEEYSIKFFEPSFTERTHRSIPENAPPEEIEYIKVFFRADSRSKLYKREDYQLLVYLGDLGGLIDFVIIFCYGLSHPFVQRLFQAALIEQAYRLQKFLLDTTPYYRTKV